jgi:hypothetical protein
LRYLRERITNRPDDYKFSAFSDFTLWTAKATIWTFW